VNGPPPFATVPRCGVVRDAPTAAVRGWTKSRILRYPGSVRRPFVILGLLGAWQAPGSGTSGFTTSPPVTTAPEGTSDETSSSGAGDASTSTMGESTSSSGGESTPEPPLDLGVTPDFGDGPPAGCKGKIDFLFVISRHYGMEYFQERVTLAFPQFIATIATKFEDFDYHIMVIDGDGPLIGWGTHGWGDYACNEACPDLSCTWAEPCCPEPAGYPEDEPCCLVADYPCDYVDDVTVCDEMWGAGVVTPAGKFASNRTCELDSGLRFIAKGQTDLEATFECIARVGTAGDTLLGQAFHAAMQNNINDPGGCNAGFLRKDALLMVTFISSGNDELGESEGNPVLWAEAVLERKDGDPESIVMLDFGSEYCGGSDRICTLTKMFPYSVHEYGLVPDYGPAFDEATDLVETACAGFVPPG
jgi:hypothetical protein